jgi:hypothetical protein
MALWWSVCRAYLRFMQLSTTIDRVLGRARLDIRDGGVRCPVRGSRTDIESCLSCPFWKRTEVNLSSRGVVVCRPRALCAGVTTQMPPI